MKSHPQALLFQLLVFMVAGWLRRADGLLLEYLMEENRVLREQQGARRLRFTLAQRGRLAVRAHAVGRAALRGITTLVTPQTLLRWYRELIARKYDSSSGRRAGRARTQADLVELVVTMARENPTWGYTRIRGALFNLGCELARSTIAKILEQAGLEPAPERQTRGSWATFLKIHAGAIAAIDFFSVEVATGAGLVRYLVLFAIDIKTRAVAIAGITPDAHQAWVVNALRGPLDPVDGLLRNARYVSHDRDPLFGKDFVRLLQSARIQSVRLPARSPNLNAFAERFVGSIRRECLSCVIPIGERHLRQLVAEYVAHYHLERNHQGLGNRPLAPLPSNDNLASGAIRRRERLGGLLSYYHRDVA